MKKKLFILFMILITGQQSFAFSELVRGIFGGSSSSSSGGMDCPDDFSPQKVQEITSTLNQVLESGSFEEKVEVYQTLAAIEANNCRFLVESTRAVRFSSGTPISEGDLSPARTNIRLNPTFTVGARNRSRCTEIDNKRPPISERVRDQGETLWCYANTAADLLSHKLGEEVSAIDIANAHNDTMVPAALQESQDNMESELDSGFAGVAMEAALERGLCREEDLYSDDNSIQELKEIEALKREFDKLGHDNFVQIYGCQAFVGGTWNKNGRERVWNPTLFNNLSDIYDIVVESTKYNFVDKLIARNCENRIHLEEKPKVKSMFGITSSDTNQMINKINQQLESGDIVGISYFYNLMANNGEEDPEQSLHASTVVARKFDAISGKCMYQVRNTWGDDWGEDGYRWVNETLMAQMVYGIDYLED